VVSFQGGTAGGGTQTIQELVTQHLVVLTGLESGVTYTCRVRSVDALGNLVESAAFAVTTRLTRDVTPPGMVQGPLATPRETEVTIEWTASEPASFVVRYGVRRGELLQSVGSPEMRLSQRAFLSGLTPGTRVFFEVELTDLTGNTSVTRVLEVETLVLRDLLPPVIFSIALGYVADKTAVVTWVTDELADSHVFVRAAGSPFFEEVADGQLVIRHTLVLSNLRRGVSYQFVVASFDAAGNLGVVGPGGVDLSGITAKRLWAMAASGELAALLQPPGGDFSFETAEEPDLTPPVIVQLPQVVGRSEASLTIQWQTDEASNSEVRFAPTGGVSAKRVGAAQEAGEEQVKQVAELVTVHTVTVTGLAPGVAYQYQVASTDPSGNAVQTVEPAVASTETEADVTPPVLRDVGVQGLTDRQATIVWVTDELANSSVRFGTHPDSLLEVRQDAELVTAHSVTLTNLVPATTYYYRVTSVDVGQNLVTAAETFRTKTEAAPDVTPPGILPPGPTVGAQVLAQGLVTATIEWVTDELSNSFVVFGTDPSLGSRAGSGELVAVHRVPLPNLTPGVEVFYRVGSEDASGNQSALSEQVSFIPLADVEAPAGPVGLVAFGGNEQVRLVWRRNVEADLAGYTLRRSVAGGGLTTIATGVVDTVYLDSGVPNDVEVRYTLVAIDQAGNRSGEVEVRVTPSVMNVPAAPLIVGAGPLDGEGRVRTQAPNLMIANAVPGRERPDAALTYTFVVYRDAALKEVVASMTGVPEGALQQEAGADSGQTVWHVQPPLGEEAIQYWWRARANDGVFDGPWSEAGTFVVAPGVAVEVGLFTVRDRKGVVEVNWVTVYEENVVGFNVYRATAADGQYTRLNRFPITGRNPYLYRDEGVEVGRSYFYKLEAVDLAGGHLVYGPVAVEVQTPDRYVLAQNYPNPFNPETVIRYQLPRAGKVVLTVYNISGQEVRTLVDRVQPAGYYRVVWDGKDRFGREAASGIYLYRLEAPSFIVTRKMLLLR
jgi:hypothetical protein